MYAKRTEKTVAVCWEKGIVKLFHGLKLVMTINKQLNYAAQIYSDALNV